MAKKEGPAGDPQRQAEIAKKVKLEQYQWNDDLRAVMSTPQGRRVLWRLLNIAPGSLFSSDFNVVNTSDANAYLEGCRAMSIYLWEEMKRVELEALLALVQQGMRDDEEAERRVRDENE